MLENLAYLHYGDIYKSDIYKQEEEGLAICLKPPKSWVMLPLAFCAWLGSSQMAEAAPLLRYGDSSEAIVSLQNQLKQADCFPKTTRSTGYYGTVTRAAVEKFQQQNGLVEDGIAGSQTYTALAKNRRCEASNPDAVLKSGDANREVKLLQIQLNNWGFPLNGSKLEPTGRFDAPTQKALKEFEAYFNLEQDGVFDSLDSELLWTERGDTLASLLAETDSAKLKQALAAMGPKAFSYLPLLLQTDKYRYSADTLRAMKPEAAVSGIKQLLKSKDKSDRATAGYLIYALRFTEYDKPQLNPNIQNVVPTLISLLRSQDKDDRFVAASALGDIGAGARAAVPDLIELLKKEDEDDLAIAEDALGGIWGHASSNDRATLKPSAENTVRHLIPLLTDDRVAPIDERLLPVSYFAIGALEKIGSDAKRAIPALVDQLQQQKTKNNPKDRSETMKIQKAALALAKIAPSQTSALFQAPALGDDKTRRGVAFAIGAKEAVESEGKNVDPKVVSKLQEIVQNRNENLELRETAAITVTLLTKDVKWLTNFAPLASEWNRCPHRKSETIGIEEEKRFYFDPAIRKCQLRNPGVGNGIKSWRNWFAGKIGKRTQGRRTG